MTSFASQLGLAFDADAARDRERILALIPELALRAGRYGITSSDVRITAVNRGILTGQESEAHMNRIGIGRLMLKAGLYRTSQWRNSSVPQAKGSPNRVYVTREWAEDVA